MASCPSGPQGHNRGTESLSAQSRPASEPAAGRELLESVLEWAETTLSSDDPLEVADVEAMREVARRHPGSPLVLDPVVVELVQVVLQSQFRSHPTWLPVCASASRAAAETLLEDPVSRERLEGLWGRLLRGKR